MREITGQFDAIGDKSGRIALRAGVAAVALDISDTAEVVVERMTGAAAEVVQTLTASGSTEIIVAADGVYRLRCTDLAEEGTVDWTITEHAITLARLDTRDGDNVMLVDDDGMTAGPVLRLGNDVQVLVGDGAPVDEDTGAGDAGKGSIYIDYTNGKWYGNTGTKAVPTWTELQQVVEV